VVTQKFTH
jgi:hypothetical protein